MAIQTELFSMEAGDEPHKHKIFLYKRITSEPTDFECHSGKVVQIYSGNRHVIGIGWVHKFYMKIPGQAEPKEFAKRETIEQYLRTH